MNQNNYKVYQVKQNKPDDDKVNQEEFKANEKNPTDNQNLPDNSNKQHNDNKSNSKLYQKYSKNVNSQEYEFISKESNNNEQRQTQNKNNNNKGYYNDQRNNNNNNNYYNNKSSYNNKYNDGYRQNYNGQRGDRYYDDDRYYNKNYDNKSYKQNYNNDHKNSKYPEKQEKLEKPEKPEQSTTVQPESQQNTISPQQTQTQEPLASSNPKQGYQRKTRNNQQQQNQQQDTEQKENEQEKRVQQQLERVQLKKEDSNQSDYNNNHHHNRETFSDLALDLIKKFKYNKAECPICYSAINKQAKIWNCVQCFQPFHLHCTVKWIKNSNKEKSNQIKYNWSCPKCCYQYNEKIPEYVCFCNRVSNPEHDDYNIAHSCGDTCNKLRGEFCKHPCTMPCHPGPCPPCNKQDRFISCYCMQSKKQVKCSEKAERFECEKVCSKLLNCKYHECKQQCHTGNCQRCNIMVNKSCFCGKVTQDVNCASQDYSCNQTCDKLLSCGNHKCQQLCHEGPCQECHLLPKNQKTCYCGRTQINLLLAKRRNSCLDPIPVCGLPCGKKFKCGKHNCKQSCHEGPCPDCKVIVDQVCRCKASDREVECYKASEQNYLCDLRCKKKKSCGIHKCDLICCEAKSSADVKQLHLCLKVCEKILNCGIHNCVQFCHMGYCESCKVTINNPISCNCGKTQLNPPNPCGTQPPECKHPCIKQKECGHPCHLNCHMDECPPCEYPVDKLCLCGSQMIKEVSCSKQALCIDPCQKILSCGHKCLEYCHTVCPKENSPTGCDKKCQKVKEGCQHLCMLKCHPGLPCEQQCKVEVKIKCECGNRETFIQCFEQNEKQLKCNNVCLNLKRFGKFYDSSSNGKQVYYHPLLVKFAKQQEAYLSKLEQKLQDSIKSDTKYFEIPFKADDSLRKNSLQILVSQHYNSEIEFYIDNVKNPFAIVRVTDRVTIPNPTLSEYLKLIEKKVIKPEILPFEITIKFINISLSKGDSLEELNNIIREFQDEYYLEVLGDKQVLLHFWSVHIADKAAQKLKKSYTNFNNFAVEVNQKLKNEEEKYKELQLDIIAVKPKKPELTDEQLENQFLEQVKLQQQLSENKQPQLKPKQQNSFSALFNN